MKAALAIAAAALALPASASAAAEPVAAQPVAVRLIWDGDDTVGGVVFNGVRSLIAASKDKRETAANEPGVTVLLQTMDPARQWSGGGLKPRMTVYALVINRRAPDGGPDLFGTAALGYCAFADAKSCSDEIVAEIDAEIAKRGLK
jgi:hypothetical protein